jgi:DHA1 family multidrug resistance protein-like MFS transporter
LSLRDTKQGKKLFFGFEIALLTFTVYLASALYTAAIPDIIETFRVSRVPALLGLTLYVFAYGIGPRAFFLPPLSTR